MVCKTPFNGRQYDVSYVGGRLLCTRDICMRKIVLIRRRVVISYSIYCHEYLPVGYDVSYTNRRQWDVDEKGLFALAQTAYYTLYSLVCY